jgi:hypothetical protein
VIPTPRPVSNPETVPADLAPFLRGVPQLERAQILELVAGLAAAVAP